MISAYRVSHGLGPVAVDRRLNTVAAAQARSNAEIGELSHDAGGNFPVRLASFGAADRARAAENLAAGSATLDATIAQWKVSGAHNRNLLMREPPISASPASTRRARAMKHFWALVLAQ